MFSGRVCNNVNCGLFKSQITNVIMYIVLTYHNFKFFHECLSDLSDISSNIFLWNQVEVIYTLLNKSLYRR